MDFYERFGKDLIALRLISAKLIEARMLAADLQPDTQQALDSALQHIETELEALNEMLRDT